MAKKSGDVKVGVSIVQPTKEKLTLLESIKIKVPKLVKNSKTKDAKTETEKTEKTSASPRKTVNKATKSKTNEIEK